MKKTALTFIFALLCAVAPINGEATNTGLGIEGYWQGKISISGKILTIGFDIHGVPEGGYSGTMEVPEQSASGIPVEITSDGVSVKINIPSIKASYEGTFLMKIINGTFRQSGMEFPLTLASTLKVAPKRPQTPAGPFPYKSEDVTFKNSVQGNTLSGTLTVPEGKGPFKAVVLVTGSGAQDRDETISDHKPFLVIADYLTRNGIAVLRYDDRCAGRSDKTDPDYTTMDLSYDAQAAVDFLRTRKDISLIGIAGHSEGGEIELLVADRTKVDFLISLAGPCIKGTSLMLAQQNAVGRAQGIDDETLATAEKMNRKIFDKVEASDSSSPGLRNEIENILHSAGLTGERLEAAARQYLSPWMYYFLKFDPRPYIDNLKIPVLVINGTKDAQVVSSVNLASLRKQTAGKSNFTIIEPEGLNHLFQHCQTGNPSEYSQIEETFSPEILKVMAGWVKNLN